MARVSEPAKAGSETSTPRQSTPRSVPHAIASRRRVLGRRRPERDARSRCRRARPRAPPPARRRAGSTRSSRARGRRARAGRRRRASCVSNAGICLTSAAIRSDIAADDTGGQRASSASARELLDVVRERVVDEAHRESGGADRAHAVELLGDAVGLAAGIPRPVVLQDDLDAASARRPTRRCRVPRPRSSPSSRGPQPERRPGVAELDRAAQRARGAAADPDRDTRPARRAAPRAGRGTRSTRRRTRGGPRRARRAARGARRRRVGRGRRTARRAARTPPRACRCPTPRTSAAAAHGVERAVALRDRERMVVAEHEHERGELDRGRARGEEAEDRERIPVRAAPDRGDVDRHRDVLAAGAEVVAERLGGGDRLGDLVDAGVVLPVRVRVGEPGDDGRDDAEAEVGGATRRMSTRAAGRGGSDAARRRRASGRRGRAPSSISNQAITPAPDGREPHRVAMDSTTVRPAGGEVQRRVGGSASRSGRRRRRASPRPIARPSAIDRTRMRIGGRPAANAFATSSLVASAACSTASSEKSKRRSDAATNRRAAATLSGTVGNAVLISAKRGRADRRPSSVGTRTGAVRTARDRRIATARVATGRPSHAVSRRGDAG